MTLSVGEGFRISCSLLLAKLLTYEDVFKTSECFFFSIRWTHASLFASGFIFFSFFSILAYLFKLSTQSLYCSNLGLV